jgi:hypothetical protein
MTMTTDETAFRHTAARLRQIADEGNAQAFLFEKPGDELLGWVVDINPAAPTRFGFAPVVTVRLPDGRVVSLWLLHAVLRREFERQAPTPGELVLVRYQGTVTPEGASAYESYVVVVDRGKPSVDWTAIATRYGDSLDRPPPEPSPHDPPEPPAGWETDRQADDIPF